MNEMEERQLIIQTIEDLEDVRCKECGKPSEKDYCPNCIENIMNMIVSDNS